MNTFLNRHKEQGELTTLLQNESNENQIILLTGYSGVGKTGLMRQLFSTTLYGNNHIRLQISKKASQSIENGYYINRLYKALFMQFSKNASISNYRFLFSPIIKNVLVTLVRSILGYFGKPESDYIIEPEADPSLIRKRDYIVACLKSKTYIIDIENIQNIDALSLEIIADIISKTTGTKWVFEYTLQNRSHSDFINFLGELQDCNANITKYYIQQLDVSIAIDLLPEKNLSAQEKNRAATLYKNSYGNLFEIIYFDLWNTSTNESSLKELVVNLCHTKSKKNHLFILDLIFLNDGSFHKQTLHTIVTTSKYSHIHDSLFYKIVKELIKEKLIAEDEDCYTIHDSLFDELAKQSPNSVLYSAYSELVNYYTCQNSIGFLEKELHLFSLFLQFADDRLLTILPDIKQYVLGSNSPQKMIEILTLFKSKYEKHPVANLTVFKEMHIFLAEVYIRAGNKEAAQLTLDSFSNKLESPQLRYLQAQVYELSMQGSVCPKIDSILTHVKSNSLEELLIKLCKLHIMMRCCSEKETIEYAKEICRNKAYRKYPAYAFALASYSELQNSSKVSLNCCKAGIKLLTKSKYREFVCYLHLNMGAYYAYSDNYEQGKALIELARDENVDYYMYLNNISALELFRYRVSEAVCNNLRDALLLVSNRFEYLIIRNNLLIAYTLLEKWELAKNEYEYLLDSGFESFQYDEFLQMNYQNQLFYCIKTNDEIGITKHAKQIIKIVQNPNTNEGTRKVAQDMLEKSRSKNLTVPCRPEMLCFWGIPPAMKSKCILDYMLE